jgi:phosphohistidine swiveling domain-containing protein
MALKKENKHNFSFSKKQMDAIDKLLNEFSFNLTAKQLIKYIKSAISAREYSKFIFTKNISDALEIIAKWGEQVGLNREELSYLSIEDILNTLNVASNCVPKEHLLNLSDKGRSKHEITSALHLPYVIECVEDVSVVPLFLNKPNFITKKVIKGQHVFLDGKNADVPDLTGKIVLIESADPGFDWIFSRQILGLITKFGGANSHMAIRCAEFGLPAAIGCGEQIFDRVLHSGTIELNCSEERIEPVDF